MASISAGTHTVQEIFRAIDFDFASLAAADYLDGKPDFRKVKIGGISFDDLNAKISIPVTTDTVVVTIDDEPYTTVQVELTDEQKQERAYSFETAADATDPDKA